MDENSLSSPVFRASDVLEQSESFRPRNIMARDSEAHRRGGPRSRSPAPGEIELQQNKPTEDTGARARYDAEVKKSKDREAKAQESLNVLVSPQCLDRLLVKQHVEHFEALTGIETCNQYSVLS